MHFTFCSPFQMNKSVTLGSENDKSNQENSKKGWISMKLLQKQENINCFFEWLHFLAISLWSILYRQVATDALTTISQMLQCSSIGDTNYKCYHVIRSCCAEVTFGIPIEEAQQGYLPNNHLTRFNSIVSSRRGDRKKN